MICQKKLYQEFLDEVEAKKQAEKEKTRKAHEAKIKAFEKLLLDEETASSHQPSKAQQIPNTLAQEPPQNQCEMKDFFVSASSPVVCPVCGTVILQKQTSLDDGVRESVITGTNRGDCHYICPSCGKLLMQHFKVITVVVQTTVPQVIGSSNEISNS